MLNTPMDVLHQFPVRKSKKQKQAFRDSVQAYVAEQEYSCTVEKGSMGAKNIVIGDPSKAKFLVTAHYDTPVRLPFPNLLTPCNLLTFVLYQLAIVAIILLPAMLAGIAVGVLLESPQFGSQIAELLYWILLLGIYIGPSNKNNANDNTSGVVTLLETLRTMPLNQRSRVAFVLFDLEEAGLIGSAAYRKAHKAETEKQIVLNLDCVGDGNEIVLFPTKKLCKKEEYLNKLQKCVGSFGEKSIAVCCKGFRTYPSDQKNFPYGVGIAAFRRKKGVGLYYSRIHTKRDTILEETNVNLLRAALTTLISSYAAQ